jgi:hypothetical protein
MPKIQWTDLPLALRDHLFERLRERKIRVEDLYQLKLWRESEPEAPEGPWYKDFGSFKVCGEGKFPKTFLLAGQPPKENDSETRQSRQGAWQGRQPHQHFVEMFRRNGSYETPHRGVSTSGGGTTRRALLGFGSLLHGFTR